MESSERILEGTSGHSQGLEMWMALDFIVSNCTSELSVCFSYLFLYCRKSYLSASLLSQERRWEPQAAPALNTLCPSLDTS